MRTFLLTWNPTLWEWPADEYAAEVRETAVGRSVPGRWSVGNRRGGIEPGARAFLVRQHSERGIIAVGTFTSSPFEDEHFDESGRMAWYADVNWTDIVHAEDRLPIEDLLELVPEVHWNNLMSSGIEVPVDAADRLLELWSGHRGDAVFRSPEETIDSIGYRDGMVTQVLVNRYERDPRARAACIERWGAVCSACGFDFAAVYGDIGDGYIHVHHLEDLAVRGRAADIDPVADLRPLCPNCHAMVHRQRPAMSIDELVARLRKQRKARRA